MVALGRAQPLWERRTRRRALPASLTVCAVSLPDKTSVPNPSPTHPSPGRLLQVLSKRFDLVILDPPGQGYSEVGGRATGLV